YGHSPLLGGLVALTATLGVTPYIALQLKAVAVSFDALTGGGPGACPPPPPPPKPTGAKIASRFGTPSRFGRPTGRR
ncbi:hypothetical protein GBZ48_34175, partial [Azospirillum melinis]